MTQPDITSPTLSRKVLLTDRTLRGLKPAPHGKRIVLWDLAVPSLCVRCTDTGVASFSVLRRIRGQSSPIRKTIGISWNVPFPASVPLPYSLREARDDARRTIIDMSRGIDPRAAPAASAAKEETFAAVSETFLAKHVSKLRSRHEVEMAFRRELIPVLGAKPIAVITRRDIVGLIESVAATRPHMAKHLFAHLNKLFEFAIGRDIYGLQTSPCAGVRVSNIIGPLVPRDRVLNDSEIRVVWKAACSLGYPAAPCVELLLLTGQRLREIAELTWDEIDFDNALIALSGGRTKTGVAHEIPLAPASVEILDALPRWPGKYVFSSRGGEKPIAGFSQIKKNLDAASPCMAAWRFHDLRRTFRTGLSGLPIPSNIAELCMGHAQPGLHKVYDRHSYRDEKRRAFELWADRLAGIVG